MNLCHPNQKEKIRIAKQRAGRKRWEASFKREEVNMMVMVTMVTIVIVNRVRGRRGRRAEKT